MVYVDDILILASEELVQVVADWLDATWPTGGLEWIKNDPIRFLGVEISRNVDGSFNIGQEGYIKDLLRSHGMQDALATALPCPKD